MESPSGFFRWLKLPDPEPRLRSPANRAMKTERNRKAKAAVVVGINLSVAFTNFITGGRPYGTLPVLVSSYLMDILIPFAFYFLLVLPSVRWLSSPWVRAGAVFLAASAIETAQFFGVRIFGETFDPFDYSMYALGVAAAACIDVWLLPRIFRFWGREESGPTGPGIHVDK